MRSAVLGGHAQISFSFGLQLQVLLDAWVGTC